VKTIQLASVSIDVDPEEVGHEVACRAASTASMSVTSGDKATFLSPAALETAVAARSYVTVQGCPGPAPAAFAAPVDGAAGGSAIFEAPVDGPDMTPGFWALGCTIEEITNNDPPTQHRMNVRITFPFSVAGPS
jgi:hypothetical protein